MASSPARRGSDEAPTFGTLLRELRLRSGLSQQDVCTAADVSTGYLALLETGQRRSPSLPKAQRLAWAVGASVDETNALLRATGRLDGYDTFEEWCRSHPKTTRHAISIDPLLNDQEKRVMLELYDVLTRLDTVIGPGSG